MLPVEEKPGGGDLGGGFGARRRMAWRAVARGPGRRLFAGRMICMIELTGVLNTFRFTTLN
jgi:hypothetical protein